MAPDKTPPTSLNHDGHAIYYELKGSGAPVTLIHGVGTWSDDWLGVIDRFGGRFQTIRYDLRSHGRSGQPPGDYAAGDFVDDLVCLLDHAGINKTHLAGFSLGGLIAQAFTLAHPDRVDRLALLSTVAGRTPEERDRVRSRLDFIRNEPPVSYFDASASRWFTDSFRAEHPQLLAEKKRVIGRMDTDRYAACYRVLAESDFADDLHRISNRTLVMTGEFDQGSNPRMARLMYERLPDAELIILPRLRHSVLLEAPDIVGGILREFFSD
ncbi:MAG: alpha/beta fold hydrolase [Pseudomonadota bacterium]